jgi:hypothetical protein
MGVITVILMGKIRSSFEGEKRGVFTCWFIYFKNNKIKYYFGPKINKVLFWDNYW